MRKYDSYVLQLLRLPMITKLWNLCVAIAMVANEWESLSFMLMNTWNLLFKGNSARHVAKHLETLKAMEREEGPLLLLVLMHMINQHCSILFEIRLGLVCFIRQVTILKAGFPNDPLCNPRGPWIGWAGTRSLWSSWHCLLYFVAFPIL